MYLKQIIIFLLISLIEPLEKPIILSQSINKLEFDLDRTNMYGIEMNIAEEIIFQENRRRERTANLPACPIQSGYYWNLECA